MTVAGFFICTEENGSIDSVPVFCKNSIIQRRKTGCNEDENC